MSAEVRKVTDRFWVAGQIDREDVRRAAAQGVRLIVNNRPENEGPGQTPGAEIEAEAKALGLAYFASPVQGPPSMEQIERMRAAAEAADGPVLAYCRSGYRSIVLWAFGQAVSGSRTRDELIALGAGAGYDLGSVL